MKNITSKTTYTILKPEAKMPPTIIFTSKALKWIEALIAQHDIEVGFYGVVEENLSTYTFIVTDIFYPKHQLANAATCEISPEGEAGVMNWMIAHDRTNDIAKMMAWGHSHHSMGVSPSGQDDKQAIERMEATRHHIIRIIVNKELLMSVSFFDYQQQIRFDNIVWKEQTDSNITIKTKMLNDIQSILASDIDLDKKFEEIEKVLYSDPEMEEIIEKVKKLKEENIPKNTVVSYAYGYPTNNSSVSRWNPDTRSYDPPLDPNRFPKLSGAKDETTIQENLLKEIENEANQEEMYPFGLNSNDRITTAQEVKKLMEDWESGKIMV